jgi:hypothetical protein
MELERIVPPDEYVIGNPDIGFYLNIALKAGDFPTHHPALHPLCRQYRSMANRKAKSVPTRVTSRATTFKKWHNGSVC